MHIFSSKKRLIITTIVSLCIIAVIHGFVLHQFFEYPNSSDPEKVARWIVTGNHNPKACFKISGGIIPTLRPPDSSLQSLCIYKVAEMLNDPTACALILPSVYAFDCISNATNYPQQECYSSRLGKVSCRTSEGAGNNYDIPQITNCNEYKKYNNHQVIHWCYGERARKFGELDQCLKDATKNLEIDDCYYQRAMKVDDLQLNLCQKITSNKLMQSDCTETVKAWIKYPELRPIL